jgi:hypothetical protein
MNIKFVGFYKVYLASNKLPMLGMSALIYISTMGKSMVRWFRFDILKTPHLTLTIIPTFKIIIKLLNPIIIPYGFGHKY